MIANHWSDPYTIMMGVHTMDVVIQVLCESGLVYAPFAIAIVVSIVEAMTQGADEGNAGELAVKFLRKKMLMIMPVFILAFIPWLDGDLASTTMKPLSTCSAPSITIHNDASAMIGSFSGSTTSVPLWWAIVHDFATTVTNVSVAAMPCAADLNAITTNINNAAFTNAEDQVITQAWSHCLSGAASELTKTKPYVQDWWAGHPDFLTQYAKEQSTFTVPAESAAAAGMTGIVSGSNVTINCLDGYQHLMNSSRALINANGMTDEIKKMGETSGLSGNEVLSRTAASIFSSVNNPMTKQVMVNNRVMTMKGTAITGDAEDNPVSIAAASMQRAIANVMGAVDAIAYREAIPIQTGIAEMVLLSVIPILLLFSGFDIKVCLTLSGLYFGVEFTAAISAFASWADGVMTVLLGDRLLAPEAEFVTGAGLSLYTLLPQIWFGLLSFIGVMAISMNFKAIGSASAGAIKAAALVARVARGVATGGAGAAV